MFCTEIGSCAVTSKGYMVENSVVTEADYNKYLRKYEVLDQRLGTRVTFSTEDYVLPDSSTRYLTKADLEGLTKEECRIARNEIYARYGESLMMKHCKHISIRRTGISQRWKQMLLKKIC